MTTSKRRIEKLESSLTPKQAVIKWMQDVHQYPSMLDYSMSLKGAPETAFPMQLLPNQVERAVESRLKGRPKDEVWSEVRDAVRDVIFIFHLHQQANIKLMAAMIPINLVAAVQSVGFDFNMSARAVGDAVVAGHEVIWEKNVAFKIGP